MAILGTAKMFLETEILGVRKIIEEAIIKGDGLKKEILISLGLMKSLVTG